MDKAYSLKDLAARFKARGLDVAEDAAKGAVDDVLDWYEESAKLSSTPLDDMGLIALPKLRELADGALDGIDGKVG